MKKSAVSTAVALSMGIGLAHADNMSSATFIMFDDNGVPVPNTCGDSGNCPNGVDPTLTGTIGNGVWGVASQETFFGQSWFAKSGTTFGPGTYTFDTMKNGTPNPLYTSVIVGPGQTGGHILFDWGAPVTTNPCGLAACNIDVVNVWDTSTVGSITSYTSTDVAGNSKTGGGVINVLGPNGTPGLPMIDGAFLGFMANFEFTTGQAAGAPVANDFTVFSDAVSDVNGIDMLANANDGGPPGENLSLDACSTPSTENGTVVTNLNDTCDYAPPGGGLAADDTFTYTVFDGVLTSTPGTVTVDFENEPPTCDDNELVFTTAVDASLVIPDADILDACDDPDGAEPLTIDSFTQPANGTVAEANSLRYTPNANFVGLDTFTVTISDTRNGITTPTVSVQVLDVPFGNFTMLDPDGITFGGTNDVATQWDGTLNDMVDSTNFNMTMGSASGFPFFGFPWFAHNIRVFGPGFYSFDSTCTVAQLEAGTADCGGTPAQHLDLDIPAGMIGAHVLFDWNITENIDVALLWEADGQWGNPAPGNLYQGPAGPTPTEDCLFEYVSRDADGDGTPGARMIDGPFIDFRANFNINLLLNRCLGGVVDVQKSKIKSSHNGGCTIGNAGTIGPYSRGDLWLISGVLAWLGVRSSRKRKLSS